MNKPYSEKTIPLQNLFNKIVHLDLLPAQKSIKEIQTFARENGDEELALEMEILWVQYLNTHGSENIKERLQTLSNVLRKAKENNLITVEIWTLRELGIIYWFILKNYQKGFENYILLGNALQKTTYAEYPDKIKELLIISRAFYDFRNYQKAIYYLEKAAKLPETDFNSHRLASAINMLGLCHQKLGDYRKSHFWFKKTAELNNERIKELWVPIVNGNIGYNYYLQERYEKALPLLKTDFENAEATGDYGRAAGALIPLAKIALDQNNVKLAEEYIVKAKGFILRSKQLDRLRLLYPVMSQWHIAKGNSKQAVQYLDSTLIANKSFDQKYNLLKMMKAQQKINEQKQKIDVAKLNLSKEQEISKKNKWIAILTMVLSCLLTWFYFHRKRALQKSHRLEISELSLQKTKQELENASLKLKNFTRGALEKNKLIEKLKKETRFKTDAAILENLRKRTILTEEDWMEFKNLFEKAHPGFITNLKENHPKLTPSLIRFLALSKLKLSNKEMGSMMGVSTDSIRMARHRLYKKLDLPSEKKLDDFLGNL